MSSSDLSKNYYWNLGNKILFVCFLAVTTSFNANAYSNTIQRQTKMNTPWDIGEIVVVFTIFIVNVVHSIMSKKISLYVLVCILLPLVLCCLKIIISFLDKKYMQNMNYAIAFMRCISLGITLFYNFLQINEISFIFCDPWTQERKAVLNFDNINILNEVPQKELEISKTFPQRPSILYENLQNSKFPLIVKEKIKLPVVIKISAQTNELTEKETLPQYNLIDEIMLVYRSPQENLKLKDKHYDLLNNLMKLSNLNFDVFKLSLQCNNLELLVIANHLYYILNFEATLQISSKKFRNYFYHININYNKNPFHNSVHAADVVQTFYFLLRTCSIDQICELSDLEIFSTIFAGAIHDVDHPGNNNNYEIAVQSKLAISYNDKAVLENYHLFKAFSILKKSNSDIFDEFTREDYSVSRSIIINIVLCTDMAVHFGELTKLQNRMKDKEFDLHSNVDKHMLLNQLMHACDISNPLKPFKLYEKWVKHLFVEFFKQGDKEREMGLNISFLCDRNTVEIASSQVIFIEKIVYPLFHTLSLVFPNMKMVNSFIIENKEKWQKNSSRCKKLMLLDCSEHSLVYDN